MRNRILAILLAALALIMIASCAKEEKWIASSEDWQTLPIGASRDKMKTYSDHLGRNQYQDYTMMTWIEDQDVTTTKITLTASIVGGQFLTGLQEMMPLDQYEAAPTDELATFLSIRDGNDTAFYIFYEGGKNYTVQKGKQYYLGENVFDSHMYMMIFLSASLSIFEGDANLPEFNVIQNMGNTVNSDSIDQYVREYSASDYQVYYVANNYGDLHPPLLIENTENVEYILQVLSSAWSPVTRVPVFGSGQIIRLHNDNETLNFMVMNDTLINYQIDNDSIAFQTPEDFHRKLQYIAAKEIVYKLQQ